MISAPLTVVWLVELVLLSTGQAQPSHQNGEISYSHLAQIESKIESLFSVIEAIAERQTDISSDASCVSTRSQNCTVSIQAYSGQDPCHIPAEGVVHLNHQLVWNASYCGRYPNRRGVSVIDIDPFLCRVNGLRQFDTWASSSDAVDLSTYLQYVRDGALLIGITGDEPMQQLSPALSMLRAAGVFVGGVPYRGNFAFVTQKGFSYKTITRRGMLTAPAKVDVQITGTSMEDLTIAAIK